MSMVNDRDIEEAKSKSLLDYLSQCGAEPQKISGDTVSFLSPLREETKPSFTVYQSSNTWYDFGTGDGGDIISFVMKHNSLEFLDAVRHLNGATGISEVKAVKKSLDAIRSARIEKNAEIKKIYSSLSKGDATVCVSKYFKEKGVNYHPEMGCIIYSYGGKKYIATPVPFPEKVQGLECRELGGEDRKTFGRKILWVFKRDPQRFLITESILDALAGEVLLADPNISLCALNGVGNVKWIKEFAEKYKPAEVYLAMDNDVPGQIAEEEAIRLLKLYSPETRVSRVKEHINAGVKDLHKLLSR